MNIEKLELRYIELSEKLSANSNLLNDSKEISRAMRDVMYDVSLALHHASHDIDAIIRAAEKINDK